MQEEQGCHADVHSEREGNKQQHSAKGDKMVLHGHLRGLRFRVYVPRFARLPSPPHLGRTLQSVQ
jgi:hypothetical protein